ncbi:pyridoxal phosphate-dependent aminotransferase [bacterium]|nr:pyridoxal phosphate-dependent aminotransferase [bacterium]
MPKPHEFADKHFKDTIFNRIKKEIDARALINPDDVPIALHVGDTWFDLPEEFHQPLENEPWNNRLSRYGDTQGEIELRRSLVLKLANKNRLKISHPSQVQLVFGATGGLFLAMQSLLEPGAEILTLSPQWTILRVVASTANVRLVEIPIFDKVSANPDKKDIAEYLAPYLTDKTQAIYFNNPNNPSGVFLDREHLESIAEFAKENDLWVLSDEAYEDFVYIDKEYMSIGSLPGMFERTVSVFSFSKSFAAAGLRLGYVAAPLGVIATLNPAHVGVGYEPNRPSQVMCLRGMERSSQIIKRLQGSYREGRQAAIDNCKLPYLSPDGSFYLFIDLRERWEGLSDEAKMNRMLDAGVVVSPGEYFGNAFNGWARFCYTSEPAEIVAEAAKRVSLL